MNTTITSKGPVVARKSLKNIYYVNDFLFLMPILGV